MSTIQTSVQNAVLTKTSLSFSIFSKGAYHAYAGHLVCDTDMGFCKGTERVFLFTPFNSQCYYTTVPLKRGAKLVSYSAPDWQLYQVASLNLATSELTQCPTLIAQCFRGYKSVLCTPTNYIIATNASGLLTPQNASISTSLKTSQASVEKLITGQTSVITQALVSSALIMDREISTLRDQINLQTCLGARISITNLKASQYINPSATLSILLNRPVFATMGPSTLQELMCVTAKATLVPSLWVGTRLASRPIFRIVIDGQSLESQYTIEGYLRRGIMEFMPHHHGYLIFQVQNHTLVFLNGTLVHKHIPLVRSLSLPGSTLKAEHFKPDPILMAQTFDRMAPPLSLTNLQSTVEALASINEVRLTVNGIQPANIRSFTSHAMSSGENSNFISTLQATLKPSFLNSTPWLFTYYQWASLILTLLFSVLLGWAFVAFASRTCIGYHKTPRSNAASEIKEGTNATV